jgi:hypothetical protein
MANLNHPPETTALLEHLRHLASTASSLEELQTNLVTAMAAKLPHYSWTGFYMLDPQDPDTLVLGPFVGDPTPHTHIPVNQGICGAAVAMGETVIVDDVIAIPVISPVPSRRSLRSSYQFTSTEKSSARLTSIVIMPQHLLAKTAGSWKRLPAWSARSWNSHALNEELAKPKTGHNRIL